MTSTNTSTSAFDRDWRFFLGDDAEAFKVSYDDSAWRSLDVPHDWSIEGQFDAKHPGSIASLPTGIAWYRKSFDAEPSELVKRFIRFDGVYMNSDVWINGTFLGRRPSGYSPFQYDITPYLATNGDNVLAVRVDNSKQLNSRWYSGSGIFRHVWLIEKGQVRIDDWGSSITVASLTGNAPVVAGIDIAIALSAGNLGLLAADPPNDATLVVTIERPDGQTVVSKATNIALTEHAQTVVPNHFDIADPDLWSADTPFLYQVRATITLDGAELDQHVFPLGIRTAIFDSDQGFLLNGVKTHLRGVCIHHDAGCVGAAVPERTWRSRLQRLKEMGCNALRLSHCPFPSEVYDLCDEMGFLVMDEAFDEWNEPFDFTLSENTGGKCEASYHLYFDQWSETDLRAMIRRDRRHPCVIIYSVGNEIPEQGRASAIPKLRRLIAIVREEDPTRPVTMGCDFGWLANESGLMDMLDVAGYNYVHRKYPDFYETLHRERPNQKLLGTETHQYFAYWQAVRDNPAVAGEFIWSGIDYLGEATWPSIQSSAAPIDKCGDPKPHFYYYRALWTSEPSVFVALRRLDAKPPTEWTHPDVHAHWNWDANQRLVAECYSNCDSIELFVNGESQGIKVNNPDGSPIHEWPVVFDPGAIKVVGRRNNVVVAEHVLHTANSPAAIQVTSNTHEILADGFDVAHLAIAIVDTNGVVVPDARLDVSATVLGAASLFAMGSADPQGHTCHRTWTHATYQGRLELIIRSMSGVEGLIRVRCNSLGLPPVTFNLQAVQLLAGSER